MRCPQFLTRETNILVLFVLFGIAIGWLTQNAVEQATTGKNLWLALAPFGVPVVLLMVARPVLGAVAVIGFGFVNPSSLPPFIEFGQLSLRYVDGVFALLISIILAGVMIQRRIEISREFRQLFVPLLIFLLYIGLSLVTVRFSAPDFMGASIASYFRLVLTALFAPILYLTLRDNSDVHFYHKGLKMFAMATIAVGAYLAGANLEQGETAGRTGGIIGIGPLGLISGLAVLYAFIKRDEQHRSTEWIFSLALGLLGLYVAKTAVSVFAAAVTITVYLGFMRLRRRSVQGLLKTAAVGTIMLITAALAVWIYRPDDVSGFANLSGGSFAERLMIAYAGFQIFLNTPVTGVGWQASTAEAVVGSPALIAAVRETFPQLASHYFYVMPPATLHNMYIQFLAELGILGFALFAWVCFRTGRSIARILRNIPAESPYRMWAQFYVLGLIFLLIWWNHNPLFGGQIETMLAFTFLALLANVAKLERERRHLITNDNKRGSISIR